MLKRDLIRPAIAGGAWLMMSVLVATVSAAPVISAADRCLRPGQTSTGGLVAPALTVFGEGFTPGGPVLLLRDARALDGTSDTEGAFRASVSIMDLADSGVPAVRTVTVSAEDLGAAVPGTVSNALRVRVAPLAFSVTPVRARPSTRVLWRFSGFTPGRTIHAHYVHAGRVRVSVPMAAAGGPCGTARVRRAQFPMPRPAAGAWRVQFDNSKRYSPRARPRIVAGVRVYREAG
jgi:hypothetical protein